MRFCANTEVVYVVADRNRRRRAYHLTEFLRLLDAAGQDRSSVQELLTHLQAMPDSPFSGWIVLSSSSDRGTFVIQGLHNCDAQAARSWMRFPLRRLYIRQRPAIMAHPTLPVAALAFPFSYGTERLLVVAQLREDSTGRNAAFLEPLQYVTLPQAHDDASFLNGPPITPSEPQILAFALSRDRLASIGQILGERGWLLEEADSFMQLADKLKVRPPDIIIADVERFRDPLTALATLHRLVDSPVVRLLTFGTTAEFGAQALPLIDALLPRDAGPDAIFAKVKTLAREAAVLRRRHDTGRMAARHEQASGLLSMPELAAYGVREAAEIMKGWAAITICNQYGAIYHAEYPPKSARVLSAMPKSIFDDKPFFEVRVGNAFFEEVTDDVRDRIAIAATAPYSGANIPFHAGDGGRGVLTACSQSRWADTSDFESLMALANVLQTRCEALSARAATQEFHQDAQWARIRDRSVELNVYRSPRCELAWRYRMIDDSNGLLLLGRSENGEVGGSPAGRDSSELEPGALLRGWTASSDGFAGIIDFSRESMQFAARGFSAPVALAGRGPSGTVAGADGHSRGTAKLDRAVSVVICDRILWPWFCDHREKASSLQRLLDTDRPDGMASILTIGPTS